MTAELSRGQRRPGPMFDTDSSFHTLVGTSFMFANISIFRTMPVTNSPTLYLIGTSFSRADLLFLLCHRK